MADKEVQGLQPNHTHYDAVLIVSFGGPEGLDEVMPFLENVLRGRNVPRERLLEVAKHYELFDGVSPINGQNRDLIAALKKAFEAKGPSLPIYWGNRNWHPFLADVVRQMASDGIQHALALVTSAYNSYSSCRQYLEDIARARAAVGAGAPRIDKLRAFYNHPGFIEANIENVRAAFKEIPPERQAATHIAFTAHSIPLSMAETCEYEAQLNEAAQLIAGGFFAGAGLSPARENNYQLVFQSRSGPPSQPWLEPDVCHHLRGLSDGGVTDVVIAPIGFVSDHMEVLYDLDTEAQALCDELGLNMVRAATAGTHPAFISMVRELVMEKIDPNTTPKFLGARGLTHEVCLTGSCLRG